MRLWSLEPMYLDRQGFLWLWKEALHAQTVLLGQSNGYINHPQLDRFKSMSDQAVPAIVEYLKWLYRESLDRGYKFNKDLIVCVCAPNMFEPITIAAGQLDREYDLLLQKVKTRDPGWYTHELDILRPEEIIPHPLFVVDENNLEVEPWEVSSPVISRLTV